MGIISKLIKFKIAQEVGSKALKMLKNRRSVKRGEVSYPKNYEEKKSN